MHESRHSHPVMDWRVVPELVAIDAHRQAVEAAGERLTKAIAAARRAGHSWELIGSALGITRQSAWERYRYLDEG